MANTKIPVELSSTPGIVDNSNATAITIDSSENVGIKEGSPSATLHTNSGTGNIGIHQESTDSGSYISFSDNSTTSISHVLLGAVANDLVFNAGDAERMRIDSSGNVGIGATPSSTIRNDITSAEKALQIGNRAMFFSDGGVTTDLQNNSHLDNSNARVAMQTDAGSLYQQYQGVHKWFNAASVSAGATQTMTERMRIDASGNVGIGTTSIATALTVGDFGDTARAATFHGGSILLDGGAASEIIIGDGNVAYMSIQTTDNATAMNIRNFSGSSDLVTIERTTGNVGIGTSSPVTFGAGTVGLTVNGSTSHITWQNSGTNVAFAYNNGNDFIIGSEVAGSNTIFTSAGSQRMRIDSSGNLLVGTTTSSGLLSLYNSGQTGLNINTPTGTNTFAAFQRNASTVGSITTNGSTTSFNTSSDGRLKDVTGEARGLEVINELNPVAYNWKESGQADEGLIAQEVLDIVPNAVTGSEEEMYSMDYSKLVVHLVKGMKEQQAQIEALQSEINELKNS